MRNKEAFALFVLNLHNEIYYTYSMYIEEEAG